MADINVNLKQTVSPKVLQRTVLVGRVKMAQAIKMPESEWAKLISDVEKDPLFQELLQASAEGRRIVRFKRFGQTGLSSQFYEMQDVEVAGGTGVSPEALLDQKKHLLELIHKVGQENFERYFLYREKGDTLPNIASQAGLTVEEARQLQEFIVDMSVQAEFYHPSALESPELVRPTLIGQIIRNEDKTFSISFFSPHLARGMYDIDRNALRRWQKGKKLDRTTAARLRKYVGILELSNLKQGAFWRVIDHLLKVQKDFLETQDLTKMAPISLRKVAAHLQFAPSTISRVMSSKSVLLPWNREVMLTYLMPGQRKIILSVLEKMMTENANHFTDLQIAKNMEATYGLKISRRTITACRHVLLARQKKDPAE